VDRHGSPGGRPSRPHAIRDPLAGAATRTIREALAGATRVLAQAGCETPRLDAELLLAEAAGVDRARLVVDADSPLDPAAAERFKALVARRAQREPVAYILGRKEFRRITPAVDPRVLIPRPETELLVDVGLTLPRGARVVDVGTGSGAVALALKHERPDLELTGTDVSEDALAVARDNARRLGLDVSFERADLLAGVEGPWDAVLANLPYVADGEELQPEIARYEPAAALSAGPDGLDVIRRLVTMVAGVPLLALEVGAGQAGSVRELLGRAGFESAETLRDLAGRERVVVGRW
jgi:release factor glutamine methyltransferase